MARVPAPNISLKLGVGIEYLYGEREDKDGENGFAHRLQMAVQYTFDIAAALRAGEYLSVREAAMAAGIVKARS